MPEDTGLRTLTVQSYFDGHDLHDAGPCTFCLADGQVAEILPGDGAADPLLLPPAYRQDTVPQDRAVFAMPGLVEAHAHLFLDGAELDFKIRTNYLKEATHDERMSVARESLKQSLAAGITLIRDAGDIHGINLEIREEQKNAKHPAPRIRAPGRAIRKKGRYGSFMASEVDDIASIDRTVDDIAPRADDLKILMTGIIDFKSGQVKGKPQFTPEEARALVARARHHGLPTFAHCSGLIGIRRAVNAGINSIEHGFFVDRDTLGRMADGQVAWVPTFAPVQFQWERPEIAGWDEDSVAGLRSILDAHQEHLLAAHELGTPVVAGTDAGSPGVPHGLALLDELALMHDTGLPVLEVLRSVTSRARRLWGYVNDRLAAGADIDLITLEDSPFTSIDALKRLQSVYLYRSVTNPHTPVC